MSIQKINKAEIFLLSGSAEVKVNSGSVSVIGAEFDKGKTFNVPTGKRVPVETISEGELDIKFSDSGKIERLEKRTIPELWDELAEKILKEKRRKILILGEVDTGKSFFTTYISNKLIKSKVTVGILDCDVGQSDVGPPGTLGLAICDKDFLFLSSQPADEIFFIGSLSPGLHLTSFITGIDKLTTYAVTKTDFLIIDTTGWVQGDGGRQVKQSKIDIIQPDIIILLQRDKELEHLVRTVHPDNVFRLPVSKKASNTSQGDRKTLRELVSINYFKDSKSYSVSLDKIKTERSYFKSGYELKLDNKKVEYAERLSAWEGILAFVTEFLTPDELGELKKAHSVFNIRQFKLGTEKYLTVALLDKNRRALGLGNIEKFDFNKKSIILHSPISDDDFKKVEIIQFGSNRTDFSGKEMGFISPGSL